MLSKRGRHLRVSTDNELSLSCLEPACSKRQVGKAGSMEDVFLGLSLVVEQHWLTMFITGSCELVQ